MQYWDVAWLNQNEQRNYPLSDTATRLDTSQSFTLPTDVLLDFVWPVQNTSGVDPSLFHVFSVQAYENAVSIAIGYDGVIAGSVSIPRTHVYGQSYYVNGTDQFADSTGILAIGDISEVLAGFYEFDVSGGSLSPVTIRPSLKGVSGVRVVQGSLQSDLLTGDIELTAGSNVQFSVTSTDDGYSVRIDAIADSQLEEACDCTTLAPTGDPIYTINNVIPIAGNIDLIPGNDCVEITPYADRGYIEITNTCATSCCGCEELEVVVDDLNTLNVEVQTLLGVANRVDAQVTAMSFNLLASKLGDSPCSEEA